MKYAPLFTLLFSAFSLCPFLPAATPYKEVEDRALLPLLTPTFAERKTAKIILENGLEVYLVSDPHIEKSGAALTVNVGSWQDPEEYPGLAHFLEHMLFLGTKKFPEESGYQNFIAEHGGSTNAFTANDITSFLFSVNTNAFEEALERFSDFFKNPLFLPSGVDRELRAIDQEYAKNVENDDHRLYAVIKELAHPGHPHHHFTMGNSSTLSKVSQSTLIKWYQDHYSANLMHLAVYSPLSIEILKEQVVKDFADIITSHRPKLHLETPISREEINGHLVYIEPVKDLRSLVLLWNLPSPFTEMTHAKPENLLCHVLGHEGPNSLLSDLKRDHLAESLKCGGALMGPGTFSLYIEVGLTDKGVSHYDTVIEKIFQTIALLKEKDFPEYIYEEVKNVQTLHYQFQPREEVFNTLMTAASQLVNEDLATYPERTAIIQEFDPAAIRAFVDYLSPLHAQFFLTAPSSLTNVPLDKEEKWLGVHYAVHEIPRPQLQKWEKGSPSDFLALPSANPFIPTNLHLNPLDKDQKISPLAQVPLATLVLDNKQAKVYVASDNFYRTPSAYLSFEIKTPEIKVGNSYKMALGELYVKSLEESLNVLSYDALVSGLNYALKVTDNGISITLYGYNDKTPLLFEKIVKQLKNVTPTSEQFESYKTSKLREFQNFSKEMPLKQAGEMVKTLLRKEFTSEKQKAKSLQKVTFEKFTLFTQKLFNKSYVEGIIYGNLSKKQAENLATLLVDSLGSSPYLKENQYHPEVIILPKNQGPFYHEASTPVQGNAVILAVEYPDFSFKYRAAQQILMQGMAQPFFTTLRTVQQTGYIVYNTPEELEKKLFNFFAVQSNSHEVRDLLARFELFIEGYLQELGKKELPLSQFEHIRASLIDNLKNVAANQQTMGELLKTLAFKYEGDFSWMDKRIQALQDLSYEEFLESAHALLGRANKRRFAILLKGAIPKDKAFNYQEIINLPLLKKESQYSP